MKLKIKKGSVAFHILLYAAAAEEVAGTIFASKHEWRKRMWCRNYNTYRSSIYRLLKLGLIEIIEQDGQEIMHLTKQGSLQVLMAKMKTSIQCVWDGTWWMVLFDIPESVKSQRDELRRLLLANKFHKLQASVYISPYPLNPEAVSYLKETNLILYIRIVHAYDLEDQELKKKFNLKKFNL